MALCDRSAKRGNGGVVILGGHRSGDAALAIKTGAIIVIVNRLSSESFGKQAGLADGRRRSFRYIVGLKQHSKEIDDVELYRQGDGSFFASAERWRDGESIGGRGSGEHFLWRCDEIVFED
jgi:hypothetical protein